MTTLTGNTTEIKVSPTGLTPTYNETIIVLESPNIISDNFKWIVELYKGVPADTDYELISTLTILPNPDGFGVLDVHRHIENYITTSFYPADVARISQRVYDDGLKWSIQVKEVFENARWRFDDNFAAGVFISGSTDVGFRTDGFTDVEHPFVVGDEVNILQDPGATNPSYDGDTTIVATVDEYKIVIDKPFGVSTPAEGGLVSLITGVSGNTRTIVQDLPLSATTFYSFNGVLSHQDFRNWDSSEYLMSVSSPTTTKFLLDGPREFDITINDRVWINNWMSTSSFSQVLVETDNGQFTTSQIYIPSGQHFINQNKIGPVDIINNSADTFFPVTGSLPVVDDNTTFIKYTPYYAYGSFPAVGETITLHIVDDCSKYDKIRFFYMDKLGSYLPLTFNRVSRQKNNVKRSNYSQNYGTYDSVADAWGYTTYDRGGTNYDMVITEGITCTSDWLTETMAGMVLDMLESPNVYIQNEDGDYIAINITTNSYEIKKRQNDKLINYTLTFEYANKNKSQRG